MEGDGGLAAGAGRAHAEAFGLAGGRRDVDGKGEARRLGDDRHLRHHHDADDVEARLQRRATQTGAAVGLAVAGVEDELAGFPLQARRQVDHGLDADLVDVEAGQHGRVHGGHGRGGHGQPEAQVGLVVLAGFAVGCRADVDGVGRERIGQADRAARAAALGMEGAERRQDGEQEYDFPHVLEGLNEGNPDHGGRHTCGCSGVGGFWRKPKMRQK